MPRGNGDAVAARPHEVAQAVELARQTALLHALVAEARGEILEVAVSDTVRQELILEKFPVSGAKRVIASRNGFGYDNFQAPIAPGALMFPANSARIGIRIANSGATNGALLYLAAIQRAGVPVIYLPPGGAAVWDGRLGNALWCGNVWAVGSGGVATLVGGEI